MSLLGQSLRRREDARFLRGQGRYVDDHAPPGALHAVFLRSPHAHARIAALDAAAARAMPGVRLVLTGAEVADTRPIPCVSNLGPEARLHEPPRPNLAHDAVRHVGEAVALVVADTPHAALDAAEAIAVDYDPWPAIAAPFAPGPDIHPGAPGNLAFLWRKGEHAAVAAAMAGAARVVQRRIPNPRAAAAPLEPRAAVAWAEAGRLHLLCNGQDVHGIRAQLCAALRLEAAALHVLAPDVGGGFGVKNVAFPEHVALLRAAALLGAPLRWCSTQAEDFAAAGHGRAVDAVARLALDAEGGILALEVEAVAEMGAYLSGYGPHCPTNSLSTAIAGCHRVPLVALTVRGAFTNASPVEAYRGAGKPEANLIIETLLDAAGLDRARTAWTPPHDAALGQRIRDGAPARRLAECALLADQAGFPARRAASEARGLHRGFGLATFLETARGTPGEWARLRWVGEGLELAIGTQSNGQGHETSFPQYAAALLDLDPGTISYVQADTDRVARGAGHGGARSLHQGGEAIRLAAAALLGAARTAAARLLQCDPGALHYAGGRFALADGRALALATIAAEEGGLEGEAAHGNDVVTHPNGAHAAEVELDPATGEWRLLSYTCVDDYGTLLNPLLTRGSVQGGLAQGIGQALGEAVVHDADGQLLTAGFMDYRLPRAADLPGLHVHLREDQPTGANALGAKGSGQAGAIAAPPAVLAALRDAAGAEVTLPATPEAVWRALRG
ncbi:xanthine dehydrogenase family protein molybdopterin-binding subunit [Roseococcus sp. DSY-14]|uniref:xanthine dehydrogenase family protein molybdopterin-binding subunit n=1 Tax=Roseococcus sp. DSY-14 TaxID=3369650 RepID=UPI00387A9459